MIFIRKINKDKAELLATRFFGGDHKVEGDLFIMYQPMIEAASVKIARTYSTYKIDTEEIFARLSLKFCEALRMWNPNKGASFYSYWFSAQRSECGAYLREEFGRSEDNKGRQKLTVPLIEELDSPNLTTDIDSLTRKNDQVALVASMLDASGKSEQKYRAICNVIYNSDKELSLQEIGDLVGESKQTVGNRIKRFRNVFFENNFGEIYDYLTVA